MGFYKIVVKVSALERERITKVGLALSQSTQSASGPWHVQKTDPSKLSPLAIEAFGLNEGAALVGF